MTDPRWIDVPGPPGDLKALTWGPPDGPIALCLHGFPDTAYGWRKVAPLLAQAGWRVVAPFMRGYAPSAIPDDGSYHGGAMMDDALRVRSAAGGTDRDVVIGHDWGALAATGLAAMPNSPFTKAVIMSLPVSAGFRGQVSERGRLAPPTASSAAAQLVHLLLSIACSARAFRPLDTAVAVAAVVAGLSRRRGGSASRRRRDRDTAELAGGAGHVPGHGAQYPAAGAVCRIEPALDRGANPAELVSTWPRRRLHDTGFRALDREGAAARQRREHRRSRRAFPAARTAGQSCRAGAGIRRLSRLTP